MKIVIDLEDLWEAFLLLSGLWVVRTGWLLGRMVWRWVVRMVVSKR